MATDIVQFCATNFYCARTTGGICLPWQLGHSIYAEKPSELLPFNFLFMGGSSTAAQYLLLMKDHESNYCWMEPAHSLTAMAASDALVKWFASFGATQT